MSSDELTAAQLSELTGVPGGTLRVWESRYAFPSPERGAGGRKRYVRGDVDRIAAVLEHRRQGVSLAAAIERVKAAPTRKLRSVYASLRGSRPDLAVHVMTKSVLIALSYALEDEMSSRAVGGLLCASFQHERHFRTSERRWRSFARTADLSVVLADFPATRIPAGGPIEVSLGPGHPLEREWTLIVNSPTLSACLAAVEVPEPTDDVADGRRRFESVWSFDPAVVADATRAFVQIAEEAAPELGLEIPEWWLQAPPMSAPELRVAADLSMRAVSYVAAREGRPWR